MRLATTITRLLFGAWMLINGVNYFLPLYPLPHESTAGIAFREALIAAGVMAVVKVIEAGVGIALVANRYVPAAICLAMPLAVVIFINDIWLERTPPGYVVGTLHLLVNLYLMFAYGRFFAPLTTARALPDRNALGFRRPV